MNKVFNILIIGFLQLLPAVTFSACTSGSDDVSLCTLGGGEGANNIARIINKIIGWVLGFGAAIAVLFIVYGGFQYITAGGNEKRAETAKATLTWAVLGLVILLLAQLIVKLITNSTLGILST